jgi:drug/metabolite transporter (DMT)-like permease
MHRYQADLILLATAAIWGLAFVFQKTAMSAVEPFTFIAARAIVASIALAPLAWHESRQRATVPDAGFVRIVGAGGLAFLVGAAFQQFGLLTASVTNTGFLTALYVIFVPIIGWGWSRAVPAPIVWPATVLSFIGMWLLGGGTVGDFNSGDLLVAICAVFWAAHVVITGHAGVYNRPITFTCLQFVVVAVLATISAACTETVTLAGLSAALPAIAYVGLLSSALTFTLFSIAIRHTPPSEAAIIVSTENLFGALAGSLLLGERLGLVSGLGAALIVIATLLVQLLPGWRKPV